MSFHPLTQLPIEHNVCSGLQCLGTYLTTTTSEPVCCTTCYQMNVQSLVIHDSASSPGVSNVLGQQRIYCCFFLGLIRINTLSTVKNGSSVTILQTSMLPFGNSSVSRYCMCAASSRSLFCSTMNPPLPTTSSIQVACSKSVIALGRGGGGGEVLSACTNATQALVPSAALLRAPRQCVTVYTLSLPNTFNHLGPANPSMVVFPS